MEGKHGRFVKNNETKNKNNENKRRRCGGRKNNNEFDAGKCAESRYVAFCQTVGSSTSSRVCVCEYAIIAIDGRDKRVPRWRNWLHGGCESWKETELTIKSLQ